VLVQVKNIDKNTLVGAEGAFVTTRKTTVIYEDISIGTIGSGYDFEIDW
jgi:hypothetical protein